MNEKKIYDFTTDDFCWTTTTYSKGALAELPYIQLIGFQPQYSSTIQAINNWFVRAMSWGDANPYAGLYMGEQTRTYKFPYFNEYHHDITQSWQENTGPLGASVGEAVALAENLAKAVLPAAGVLTPRSYAGQGAATYSFTFNLINTNAGSGTGLGLSQNIKLNKDFLETLIRDNLHDLKGALTILPPLLYEVYIPGIRFSPAAIISGLSVKNKGSMNTNKGGILSDLPANYIYPDAWEVTVSITELINESRLTYGDAIENSAFINNGMHRSLVTQVSIFESAANAVRGVARPVVKALNSTGAIPPTFLPPQLKNNK